MVKLIRSPITGLDSAIYLNWAGKKVIVTIKGIEVWDPRDMLSIPIRRSVGFLKVNKRHFKPYIDAYGNQNVMFVGHSGGGSMASWLASEFETDSITFNSTRAKDSFNNSGEKQTNIIIAGDRWGDPWSYPKLGAPLPGRYLVLENPNKNGRRAHSMNTVEEALRLIIKEELA